jgi:hypothetical protein
LQSLAELLNISVGKSPFPTKTANHWVETVAADRASHPKR